MVSNIKLLQKYDVLSIFEAHLSRITLQPCFKVIPIVRGGGGEYRWSTSLLLQIVDSNILELREVIIELCDRYGSHESAATAIVKCNGMDIDGCLIKVNCCFCYDKYFHICIFLLTEICSGID